MAEIDLAVKAQQELFAAMTIEPEIREVLPKNISLNIVPQKTTEIIPTQLAKPVSFKAIFSDDAVDDMKIDNKNSTAPPVQNVTTVGAAAAASNSAAPAKRKAGRPSKNPPKVEEVKKGIVSKPIDSSHIIELKMQEPIVIKKLLNMLGKYKCAHVNIEFDETLVKFFAELDKGTQVRAYVDCEKVISYYIGDVKAKKIQLSRTGIEGGIKPIDKQTCNSVTLALDKAGLFRTIAEYMDKDKLDRVEKSQCESFASLESVREIDITVPPVIRFEIPVKTLKSMITTVKKKSLILRIEKGGEKGPLILKLCENSIVLYETPFLNPEHIKLKSAIKGDTIFTIPIRLGLIQNFISSAIFDNITIMAYASGYAIFGYQNDFWKIFVAVQQC